MIHIIYLAAGNSKRFGSNKLVAPLAGKPVFLYGLECLAALTQKRADCDLTVVTRTLEIVVAAARLNIPCVESSLSEKGISFSIRAGIDAVEPLKQTDYLLFVLADQPWLTCESVNKLLDITQTGCVAATASFGDIVGSPTLFSANLSTELKRLEGDQGGRRVLNRYPKQVLRVQVGDIRELLDIDQPNDLLGEAELESSVTIARNP